MTSSYLRGDDQNAPLRIHADRAARTMRVEWADDHVSVFDFERLRWLCPCAYCRGEMGQPGWLDSNPVLTAEQTRLVSVEPVVGPRGHGARQYSRGQNRRAGFYKGRQSHRAAIPTVQS